jgi:hypothetical protein
MERMRTNYYLALLVLATACTSTDDGGEGNTTVSGQAVYRDASTDHSGAQRTAASPPAQEAKLSLTIKGSGTIPEIDPRCLADAAGTFEARYAGAVSIEDAYAAAFAKGTITTPSGCEIPELTVGAVTDVVLRAELATTTQNCQSYCEASARADAEASCGATSSSATCRQSAESSATASCMTTCTSQKTKIVAEASLGVATLGQVDANALRTATFADLEAKLVFDALE